MYFVTALLRYVIQMPEYDTVLYITYKTVCDTVSTQNDSS